MANKVARASLCLAAAVLYFSQVVRINAESSGLPELQADLAHAVDLLKSRKIATIEILHVPYATETRAAVNPDMLGRMGSRCQVSATEQIGITLQKALAPESVRVGEREGDLRWGIWLRSPTDEIAAVFFLDGRYITGTGRRGRINDRFVAFDGSLARWAETVTREHCASISL